MPPGGNGAADLARLIEALADPAAAARLFFTPLEGQTPGLRYYHIVANLPRLTVVAGTESERDWQGEHHVVRVVFDDPLRLEIVLPNAFRSLATANAYLRSRGHHYAHYALRARQILSSVCDMVLSGRLTLLRALRERLGGLPRSLIYRVSPEDGCPELGVVTLSRNAGTPNPLVPDGYFYDSDGYLMHKERVALDQTPWSARNEVVLWRGATTGSAFTADTIEANERIRLAARCAGRDDLFDVKISSIVQVPASEEIRVREVLTQRGLMGAPVKMDAFRRHKFALHIDGNKSAAGLFEKMALGCCVLLVPSRFEQWIEPRLQPWVHYVPVRPDLGDLIETAQTLRHAPVVAERIAAAASDFAVAASFDREAQLFCLDLVAAIDRRNVIRMEAPPPEARAVVLSAPPDGKESTAWNGVEKSPSGQFRWTREARISWRWAPQRGRMKLQILVPAIGEVEPGFAAAAQVEVNGQAHPVAIKGTQLHAEIACDDGFDGVVTLVTPAPRQVGGDTRRLGLSVIVQ